MAEMGADELGVLEANDAFYDAFVRRDAVIMESLWARRAPVACVHPGWPPLEGRDVVVESWRRILAAPNAPVIRYSRAVPHVLGESAFVICYEHLEGGALVATNVFRREEGEWRLVHHQASPARVMPDEAVPDVVH